MALPPDYQWPQENHTRLGRWSAPGVAALRLVAIQREGSLKCTNRAWKINLIERTNPHWDDLYPTLPGVAPVRQLLPRGELDPRHKADDDS